MNNILFCNAGRRGRLINNFTNSKDTKIVATDNWTISPAIYLANKQYQVPKIYEVNYLDVVFDICKKEKINAITTLIDPEIELLAKNRDKFLEAGILPLCPDEQTAELCFDKYKMFLYLKENNIRTVLTFNNLKDFNEALTKKQISFPVFVKPVSGSGSVGAQKVNDMETLNNLFEHSKGYSLIIQELMQGVDCNADVYVDCISNKVISIFAKNKLETKIGGANKTISFKDTKLSEFIEEIVEKFNFFGPIDMDFFVKDGEYYLSEINPRFGGSYIHAYGAGVDFLPFIEKNIKGEVNEPNIFDYEEDILMLMYDDIVIKKKSELTEKKYDE